jgi:hypothetical protein
MGLRERVKALYERQVADLVATPGFQALESGTASGEEYDAFVARVVRTHLHSPQLVAFCYALAPPDAAELAAENLLEELGMDSAAAVAHPDLLRQLARGAGLGPRLSSIEQQAERDIRTLALNPVLAPTLAELGLAALAEIVAFEFMLSRVAGRMARALAIHRGLDADTLAWFTLHSEVDVEHAEHGLDHVVRYARWYGYSDNDAFEVAGAALRENVFTRRYLESLP